MINRRQLFSVVPGVGAIGLLADKDMASHTAYRSGYYQCGKCLNAMLYMDDHISQPREKCGMYCPNPNCEEYEIKYLVPTVLLERAL